MIHKILKPLDPKLAWFPKLRFGMFIHFGLYSLLGRHEWAMRNEGIPRAEYERLMKRFNPKRFNAEAWVAAAQRMGAKYIAITTKHHDGFCLFDSALTDYKITNTPFKRDLIGELIAACQKAGMRIVLYYSQPDWHHPNYAPDTGCAKDLDYVRPEDQPDWDAYLNYYFGQVRELCSNYGRIDGIWFDGTQKPEARWQGRKVYEMIKSLQPHAVVNDRAGYGDTYTPERRIATAASSKGYMVEACQSVAKGTWCYGNDVDFFSTPMLIESLVRMASAGGNFLLNIGPKPDGSLPEDWLQRLYEIGDWLKVHGKAIYNTGGCPRQEESPTELYTRKGKKLYLHLLRWPESSSIHLTRVEFPPLRARLMGSNTRLKVEEQEGKIILRGLPSLPPDAAVNVVEMTFGEEVPLARPRKLATAPVIPFIGEGSLEITVQQASGDHLSFKGAPLPTYPYRHDVPADYSNLWLPGQKVTWKIDNDRPRNVELSMEIACGNGSGGSTYAISIGDQKIEGTTPNTKEWDRFVTVPLGRLSLPVGLVKLVMAPQTLAFLGRFGIVRRLCLTDEDSQCHRA
jgi:alpha-L-fucosidase